MRMGDVYNAITGVGWDKSLFCHWQVTSVSMNRSIKRLKKRDKHETQVDECLEIP